MWFLSLRARLNDCAGLRDVGEAQSRGFRFHVKADHAEVALGQAGLLLNLRYPSIAWQVRHDGA
jgi:hypothetical protein